ncbi:DEAD-domain-containing protein [Cutaneotrichosporon oleaginosum]|uniref:ATP-dependent RNA helicase n=1 Tax=Cutaneotrichosporon oleaginosum TaxID=879819 RepID=A0A0J0XY88_9TREE|nr:DEAD-domain-containing protein [Cutaneotrichosporon oleaginosum]KLT46007.1 DEAD-domain-containing protein [Cutaneotrichosporon oleaginosum]TXT06701.1 hypothetical protein COLE_06032 [Cutaneotrichosporon oleaginosum]
MPRPAPRAPAFGGAWSTLTPPLTPWISDVIAALGFDRMTPVQAGTIPRAIKNQDCVVEAVTGSGKTLAFVVPVLERIVRSEHAYKRGEVAAVVIAPTRELASQIHEVFNMFLSTFTPKEATPVEGEEAPPPPPPEYPLACLVTGGTAQPYETFFAQASNILVGTPGRLASFLLSPRGMSAVRVGNLDVLVLDEADRLLSAPDHRRDVERIMRHLPKQRRTHLFSATMTDAVEDLVGVGLRNPVRIVVNLKDKRTGETATERRVPMGLANTFLVCGLADKTLQLLRVFQREAKLYEAAKFIVYFSTGAAVDYFYRILSRLPEMASYSLTSLHGDLPPRVRDAALSGFNAHASSHLTPAVLLCTDVAARGVDFPDIDAVIQYDAPTDPKTFSHRVGRTARAGRAGRAITLLTRGREEQYVDFLRVRKIPLAPHPYLGSDLEEAAAPVPADPDSLALLTRLRDVVMTDRDLADRGAKALVSAVRAYTKHEASFIFRTKDLDYAALGTAFGLLRLPVMPEVRDWRRRCEKAAAAKEKAAEGEGKDEGKEKGEAQEMKGEDENDKDEKDDGEPADDVPQLAWTDAEVEWDALAYADKKREAQRQAALAEKAAKRASGELEAERERERKKRKVRAELNSAWSVQKDRRVRKEERREKKDKKAEAAWARRIAEGLVEEDAPAPEKRATKRKVKEDSEEEDFADEYRALKKEVRSTRGRAEKKEAAGMFDDLD